MSAPGAWVGRCIVQQAALSPDTADAPVAELICHAAVWTDSRAGFTESVARELERQGYTLIRVDEAQPIIEWMVLHGYHEVVEPLSVQVSADHPVALGPVTPLGKDTPPHAGALNGCEPWVGRCFFREWLDKPDPDRPFITPRYKDYACHAAVWTDRQDGFLAAVKRHLEAQGYAFTWAEDILPAVQWLSRHGYHDEVMTLSPQVAPERIVVMGSVTRTGEDGQPLPEVDPVVITRHEMPTLPDQTGMPFWEKVWIPQELKALLFDQPADRDEPLNTYFLVDATLRKRIQGVFDLDVVDAPVKCLFDGEGSEAQRSSAPYLVDLTLPVGADEHADLVPRFHKDLFERHWAQETGIVIRTRQDFETTWRHCQRHMKVAVEGEARTLFLRYWHPETLDTLLPVLEKGDAYHLLGEGCWIYPRDGLVVQAELNPELEVDAAVEARPFILREAYLNALAQYHRERFRKTLCQEVSLLETGLSRKEILDHVDYSLVYCQNVGLKQQDSILGYTLLAALYGRDIIEHEPRAESIGDTSIEEYRRKAIIHHLLTHLGV